MEPQSEMKKMAGVILEELEHVDQDVNVTRPGSSSVLAYPTQQIVEGPIPELKLDRIRSSRYLNLKAFKADPFIAYAKTTMDGAQNTYFFTRNSTPHNISPLPKGAYFANYKSPIGRIAELDVEDEETILIPGGEREVLLLEKNLFSSIKKKGQWDAVRNTIFMSGGEYAIPSLLGFLRELVTIPEEIEWDPKTDIKERERIISEKAEEKIRKLSGLQRQVIEKMALRDQPVLDQKQGEIFRLPLMSQIIITGAPGTGKTTTLIKRIAQKMEPEFLEPGEISKIPSDRVDEFIHQNNWVMFTPTELLKNFIKEALNKESIAASDRLVKVWSDERDRIARETLSILKTGDKGYFRKTRNNVLPDEKNSWLVEYALRFEAYYVENIFQQFDEALHTLTVNGTGGELIGHFAKSDAAFKKWVGEDPASKVLALTEELKRAREIFNAKNAELKENIDKQVYQILGKMPGLIDQLFEIITKHRFEKTQESDSDDGFRDGDEISTLRAEDRPVIVKRQLAMTLRYVAEREAKGKTVARKSLHAKILEIIRPHLPEKNKMVMMGKQSIDMKVTNTLTRGYSNLLGRLPAFYQQFRRDLIKRRTSWVSEEFESAVKEKRICENEIDLLVFLILRNVRNIFANERKLLDSNSNSEILESIKEIYVTQVVVDEATDFSTHQLGSMYYLADPRLRSVTFSGDLMQRVTDSGLETWEDCQLISPSFNVHKIERVYRQSPKLLNIARILYEDNIGEKAPFRSAYPERGNEPEPLKMDTSGEADYGQWITDRILEIYQIHRGKLPSIAVFVADDDQIPAALEAIEDSLEDNSISIKGCPKGEILGSDGKVRIFSIKYIKGLEFESVFFLNINEIADTHPKLFDRYIYVGLTRAASFMGVTYVREFPDRLRNIEPHFSNATWQRLARV